MVSTKGTGKSKKSNQGFACMDPATRREIARKGGSSVPDEKRSFSTNRELASAAGKKGGKKSANKKREIRIRKVMEKL